MRRPALCLLCALLLVTAACGSRADDDAGGGGSGDLGGSSEAGGDGGSGGGTLAADSAKWGTIDNPCSGSAPEGEGPEDTPGISEDQIRIGVISDRENPAVPLPTVGVEESVKAFVELCNEAGGINGRQIELETYDSQIARTDEVTKAACRDDLFALVGSGSVQDQQGITTREGCGLPEVAGYTATTSRAASEDLFTPIPGLSATDFNVGPCRFIAEEHPEAVTKAAMVYTDLPAASTRGRQVIDACEAEAGFDFVVEKAQAFADTDFQALVSEMKSKGVRYFTMVSAASETLALLEEIETQGLELDVIDLGQQYYSPAIAEAAVADGAYVLTNTFPFEEADESPIMGLYLEYMEKVGAGEDKIATLGVQAFSAGLLWATAAAALGSDLTRDALVEELGTITEWDGGGLHMPANPGENAPTSCFLYLRVSDGAFAREHPSSDYDCDDENLYESEERFES